MTLQKTSLVIIGAGHAGGRAALALRQAGFAGAVTLIGDEFHPPYERPPLSKQVLLGAAAARDCYLDNGADYAALGIELRRAVRVTTLDADRHQVVLAGGERLDYDRLVLATGGRPRTLPQLPAGRANVHYLRTLDDAERLKPTLRSGHRLLIVGGGFIGLEVAACARVLGCEVTLLEAGDRLAARALPAALSARLLALHQGRGVDIRLGAQIDDFLLSGEGDQVRLLSGECLAYDQVLVGIGIEPNIELARAAGIVTGSGVRVDGQLRSSAEDVYAIGDVCEPWCPVSERWARLETWRNAEDQAAWLAAHFMGAPGDFAALGGFWSDQYDHSLQLVGNLATATRVVERQGEQGVLLCGLDASDRPVAAAGIGRGNSIARDIKLMERLIGQGRAVCAGQLADPATKLKMLLRISDAA